MGCRVSVQRKKPETMELKLTQEEREKTKRKYIDDVTKVLEKLSVETARDSSQEGDPYTDECGEILATLYNAYAYFSLDQVPLSFISEYQQDMSKVLIENGAIFQMCGILEEGLVKGIFVREDGDENDVQQFPLTNCMLSLVRYSDASDDVKIEIGRCRSLIDVIVKLLKDWLEDHKAQTLSEDKEIYFFRCLNICCNIASMEENIPMMREAGILQVSLALVESPHDKTRLLALATLADLVNEEESEDLKADVDIFRFIIRVLKDSLSREDHREIGWTSEELTRAIRQFARNDANKMILVDYGCLPLLVTLMKKGNDKEIKEAVSCLWVLSFKPENKMRMVQEKGLIHSLEKTFNKTKDKWRRRGCYGIFWSLRDQINSPDCPVRVGEAIRDMLKKQQPVTATESSTPKSKGHIMVSYQWGSQELIKRIVKKLRDTNVPVWMDIDNMAGSTLQSMAQAVEDSSAVIIAMSQQYKDSSNTRAEAEYAFQLGKTIIPLKVQKGYRPDGWLGIIMGSKLYYDFQGTESFDAQIEKLRKGVLEVMEDSRTVADTDLPVSPPDDTVDSPLAFDLDRVKQWTVDDKSKWLKKHNMLEYTQLLDLSGHSIVFLHRLKSEAPETFYNYLETKLGWTSILDLSNVSSALSDVSL